MASVYITADFNTPVELNKEKVKKMKSIKEKYGEIPFVIEDNKIFLFSESCFEISTQDRSAENSFVFRFFEDVSGGTLSTYRSSSREYEEENRKDRGKRGTNQLRKIKGMGMIDSARTGEGWNEGSWHRMNIITGWQIVIGGGTG